MCTVYLCSKIPEVEVKGYSICTLGRYCQIALHWVVLIYISTSNDWTCQQNELSNSGISANTIGENGISVRINLHFSYFEWGQTSFICLRDICISFSVNCLIVSFAHSSLELLSIFKSQFLINFSHQLSYQFQTLIKDTSPLSVIWGTVNINTELINNSLAHRCFDDLPSNSCQG